ncbi:MAG: hypothetical protein FP824_10525 [Euryarchaeota archaeon]|nr:hypothetical protein [Euryarchaeota archaeon]MBU4144989.1 hypothetical protein [Candidatus Thermoplasmatota archaeon]
MYYTKTGVFKDPRLENTFNADIAVFLVDCSIFTRDLEGERLEEQHYYDEQLATLISAFVKYRSENKKLSKKRLYPVFVLTQMDNMDNSIDDRPKIGEGHMWNYDSKEAHEIGNELFSKYLPLSKSVIIGASTMKVVLEENKFFFSWVQMDGKSPEGVQTMESQRLAYRDDLKDPSGHEFKGNVFARGQYLEFIMYLKEICEFTKDSSNLAKEYLDGQKKAQPINQGN